MRLQRTRNWVYKWVARAQTGDAAWYLSQSTTPHHQPSKLSAELEEEIVHSRQFLARRDTPDTRYAFCGAVGIHQDLDRKGFDHKPSLSTINRVLKCHGLTGNTSAPHKTNAHKTYYPHVVARHPGFIYQMDLVTPLYIAGYGKVVSINRIDPFESQCNLQQYGAKNTTHVLEFLIADWQQFGIPRYLQVDNEAAFYGGLYHPRSMGKFIRFCLNFGVEVIFIPFNEPWRNGHIESLNGRYQKLVWNRHRFRNLAHLRNESEIFRDQHNGYQRYRKDQFGQLRYNSYTVNRLPQNFCFNDQELLPITTGRLHFVRQVQDDGTISILNETLLVDKAMSYEYVWVVLNTYAQTLTFYHKAAKFAPKKVIKQMEYQLREPVKRRIPITHFLSSVCSRCPDTLS